MPRKRWTLVDADANPIEMERIVDGCKSFVAHHSHLVQCTKCYSNPERHKMRYRVLECDSMACEDVAPDASCNWELKIETCQVTTHSRISSFGEHTTTAQSPKRKMLTLEQKRFVRACADNGTKPSRIVNKMIDELHIGPDIANFILPYVQRYSAQYKKTKRMDSDSISSMNEQVNRHSFAPSSSATTPFVFAFDVHEDGMPNVGNGSDDNPFFLGFSSVQMMSNLKRASNYLLHVDATYKVNTCGYPVIVFGVSDLARHFYPVALFISSQTNQIMMERALQAMLDQFETVTGEVASIGVVMGDADDAQWNALNAVITRHQREPWRFIMCFFHVMMNVKKRVSSLSKQSKRLIYTRIYRLHYSRNEDERDASWREARALWAGNSETKAFGEYFEKEWMRGKFASWQCFETGPGQAKTNNPVEQFNRDIKRDYTKRRLLSMNMLFQELIGLCRHRSTRVSRFEEKCVPNARQLSRFRLLRRDGSLTASVLSRSSLSFLLSTSDSVVRQNDHWHGEEVLSAIEGGTPLVRQSLRLNDCAAESELQPHNGWKVNAAEERCNCNSWFKFGYCIHVIAARVHLKMPVTGITPADTFVNRRCGSRKRGRSGQVGHSLSRS